jgi:microsomal dipeptidase-like Zn-dependent dipeptidase
VVLGLAVLVALALWLVPAQLDTRLNPVLPHEPTQPSSHARALHDSLLVVDWHADSLLWQRDLRRRNRVGHVDVPRLVAGGVAIQMFTLVTRSLAGTDYAANDGQAWDMVTALALVQRWPPATWSSLEARALYQAGKLRRWAEAAPEQLALVRSAAELEAFLRERDTHPERVASLLGVEGAHCLEGDLSGIDRLFEAGVRMVGLTHFFDNELGGSRHGVSGAGLTAFGRQVVERLEARELIIDLAHASPRMVEDVLAQTTRPPVVSHTGIQGHCDHVRNLSDTQAKAIAARGGLIGIGYWDAAVCDPSPQGIARAIRYAADLVGVEHVALGSDYDGTIEAPFDTSELAVLTEALLGEGFAASEIAAIMGGSSVAFLRANLPAR